MNTISHKLPLSIHGSDRIEGKGLAMEQVGMVRCLRVLLMLLLVLLLLLCELLAE